MRELTPTIVARSASVGPRASLCLVEVAALFAGHEHDEADGIAVQMRKALRYLPGHVCLGDLPRSSRGTMRCTLIATPGSMAACG